MSTALSPSELCLSPVVYSSGTSHVQGHPLLCLLVAETNICPFCPQSHCPAWCPPSVLPAGSSGPVTEQLCHRHGRGFSSLHKRKVDLMVSSLAAKVLYYSILEGWHVGLLWSPMGPSCWQPEPALWVPLMQDTSGETLFECKSPSLSCGWDVLPLQIYPLEPRIALGTSALWGYEHPSARGSQCRWGPWSIEQLLVWECRSSRSPQTCLCCWSMLQGIGNSKTDFAASGYRVVCRN